ncbi:MAG: hypothetical protein JHC26_01320 [Thermofilum sp.]|jgi:uncharacterized membrane protein YhaH (DUF805 family)|uniref:hypothetical protein n=1 Tax=Thermofilum sp. TaxID=1961369 RepID=UPI00258EC624|nr:hypothetical protein [Thermofilum sp.]MCI4407700.1 hypothetical protein [Thermofilum sp.]
MYGDLRKKYYVVAVALFVLFTYPFAVFFRGFAGLAVSLGSGDMGSILFNLGLLVYGIAGFISMYIIVTVTPQFALAMRRQEQE